MSSTTRRSRSRRLQDSIDRRPNLFMGIVDELGKAIARGDLAPGSQVPVRKTLALQHRTTVVTIQKALAMLEESGLVVSRGWRGTFVHEAPPCLHRFGVLMPRRAALVLADPSSLYHSPLARIAGGWQEGRDRLVVFSGLLDPAGGDLPALMAELERHTLAGLICIDVDPAELPALGAEIARRELPCVHFGPRWSQADRLEVCFDHLALARATFLHLAARGCRRPAVAMLAASSARVEAMQAEARACGLETPAALVMGFDPSHPDWLGPWVETLMSLPPERRPDAFLIADNHLLDGFLRAAAAQGLTTAGIPIVSHANLPSAPPPAGIIGFGFDLRDALRAAMALIREARRPGLGRLSRSLPPVAAAG